MSEVELVGGPLDGHQASVDLTPCKRFVFLSQDWIEESGAIAYQILEHHYEQLQASRDGTLDYVETRGGAVVGGWEGEP